MLVLAFDVGGVHIKSGLVEVAGESAPIVARTIRRPFNFRAHAATLDEGLTAELRAHVGDETVSLVVFTITAETVGIFPTIAEGVIRICRICAASFPATPVRFLSVHAGLEPLATVEEAPLDFASANWAATATLAAADIDDGLFIDIGSTTTDIIPIVDGMVSPAAVTDLGRLMSAELVYTGMERTLLPCITQVLPLRGRLVSMATEVRAFTAHVYVLLGWLAEFGMRHPVTGCEMRIDREASLSAIARSICADPSLISLEEAILMAEFVRDRQLALIVAACRRVIASTWTETVPLEFVVAGSGIRLAETAVRMLAAGPVVESQALGRDATNATALAAARLAAAGTLLGTGRGGGLP